MARRTPDKFRAGPGRTAQGARRPKAFIEYGAGRAAKTASVASVEAAPQTLVPASDLLRARDELEKRMGGFRAIASAHASAALAISGKENIIGFGVGLRYVARGLTPETVVKVFVREKLPLTRVAAAARIPAEVSGVPTDVEPIGGVVLHSYAKRYRRPVPCGVSISHISLPGSGTLGCLVVLEDEKLCLLSNNHVLANENSAQIGDAIVQPGNSEASAARGRRIAVLEKFVPIRERGNLVDAAVAQTTFASVRPKHVTYRMDPRPLTAALGMSVLKNGRTTQSTIGVVTDIGVHISVPYDPFPAGAEMRDQIGIRGIDGAFSRAGDSGSIIVSVGTKQPVALLFAGSSDNRITFANPIGAVISALGIDRLIGPRR
jgi:hypothetical protein